MHKGDQAIYDRICGALIEAALREHAGDYETDCYYLAEVAASQRPLGP